MASRQPPMMVKKGERLQKSERLRRRTRDRQSKARGGVGGRGQWEARAFSSHFDGCKEDLRVKIVPPGWELD